MSHSLHVYDGLRAGVYVLYTYMQNKKDDDD